MNNLIGISFNFGSDSKVCLFTLLLDKRSVTYRVDYTNTGHFTFAPQPSPRIRGKLAMLVGALNNLGTTND